MCPENKFLENKSDINTLITKANKIKLDPEEYIKLYKKRNENYNSFKIEMDKNSGINYPLEIGNSAWNDFKLNNRQTVLFEKGEKESKKDSVNLQQIEEMIAEDEKEEINIIEDDNSKKNNNNINYDPKTKKISIKINKQQINKKNEDEIKIKPILERKNEINLNPRNKLIIPKVEIINFENEENNIDNYFDKNKEDENNNKRIERFNNMIPPYKKKKMDQPSFHKGKNINENKINIEDNINNNSNINNNKSDKKNVHGNNFNNNFNAININNNNNINYSDFSNNQNNYNNVYNDLNPKYYNVNLDYDNKNLERYYANNNRGKIGKIKK
jgi:hypothetical protein